MCDVCMAKKKQRETLDAQKDREREKEWSGVEGETKDIKQKPH